MSVSECNVPPSSVLDKALIGEADFRDSYEVRLSQHELGIVDIFFAIFGHLPWSSKILLMIRNALASLIGLQAPSASEVLHLEIRESYAVGEKIGLWPIFFLGENEIIAGRDNKHMDFRLSVLKVADGDAMKVVATTVCTVRNWFGKYYLRLIVPFHKRGVQQLMSNAVLAKRL
jgi:hypothetical protein